MGAKKEINTFRDFDKKENVVENKDFGALGSAEMEFYTSGIFKEFFANYCDGDDNVFREALNKKLGGKPLQKQQDDSLLSLVANDELSDLFSEFTNLLKDKKIKIGLDMPVLLTPSKESSKPLIIIVGESALRTKLNENEFTGKIHVGTPYAVHQVKGYPEQCDRYKNIFNRLLEISSTGIKEELLKKLLLVKESDEGENPLNNCSIYLTDIIKFWYEGIIIKDFLKNNPSKEITRQKTLGVKLFKNELKLLAKNFAPIYIVAFGNIAQSIIEKMAIEDQGIKYIPILHPSGQNADSWKANIYERALFLWKNRIDTNYAFERYGEEFGLPGETTSKLIAEEAFLEILREILKTTNCYKDISKQQFSLRNIISSFLSKIRDYISGNRL